MSWSDPYRLGPLGALRELPSPMHADGVEAEHDLVGETHASLYGGRTRDYLGTRRTWVFAWPWARHAPHAWLRTLARGMVRRPLRLIMPAEPNRLPTDVSAGGSETRTADAYYASGSSTAFSTTNTPPQELAGLVDGRIAWTVATGSGTARLDHGEAEHLRVPLIEGETVTASIYVRGDSGSVRAVLTPYDADGAALADVEGTSITLDGTWQRATVGHIPASGEASAVVGLLANQDPDATRTIDTTGWQLDASDAATEWELGGACPQVLVDITGDTARPHRRYDLELTLREV